MPILGGKEGEMRYLVPEFHVPHRTHKHHPCQEATSSMTGLAKICTAGNEAKNDPSSGCKIQHDPFDTASI